MNELEICAGASYRGVTQVLLHVQTMGEPTVSNRDDDTSRSQRGRTAASAEARLPYVTCEYYLHTISAFPGDRLWLASLPGLQEPHQLAAAAISHVLVLCHPHNAQFFAALQASAAIGAPFTRHT